MKLVVQRVKRARVSVGGATVGECGEGLMLLLGVAMGDTREDADALAKKLLGLRIFTDEQDKMNLSVRDIGGEALVVSNFTLMANYKKGNRPDYMQAAKPDEARALYEYFAGLLSAELSHVGTGAFGEHMEIDMCADGPVTIVMDSEVLTRKC
ncbi:MAG: D-tyrosyl-tRNA(Tyr) deacylase [Clostridia bacterium]|nr:D-tyrosyl-tRNA(Tyr) deacylase [Clostridia bacterium]MBO7250694.1 D-tyrosyl-tRNA(Tyr) deacylase [Clostridia bacterium]